MTPLTGNSPRAARVVVVDDDDLLRESLSQNLMDAGFEVAEFSNGEALLHWLEAGQLADLILLDWKMPGMNGIEVLRQLRHRAVPIPVIFLTVLSDQIYEEAALIGGAVDFIEKSRSFSILLKRINIIIGGVKAQAEPVAPAPTEQEMRIGHLVLRPDSGRALWRGREVELTLTEFHMVRLLAECAGRDVGYRQIYDLVHGRGFSAGADEHGYRANVRAFIKRIRQKFRDIDDGFVQIENYPGFGYRWTAPGA